MGIVYSMPSHTTRKQARQKPLGTLPWQPQIIGRTCARGTQEPSSARSWESPQQKENGEMEDVWRRRACSAMCKSMCAEAGSTSSERRRKAEPFGSPPVETTIMSSRRAAGTIKGRNARARKRKEQSKCQGRMHEPVTNSEHNNDRGRRHRLGEQMGHAILA